MKRLLEGALTSAERARTLISRLLGFARRQHLDARDISVRRLLVGMSDLIERSVGPTIRLVLELPDETLSARADPNQLELALLNLAVNARDAMPEGGTLTVGAGRETVEPGGDPALTAGDYVCIRVADTGHGMDAATARRAIEPFYSTKEAGRGTGLGLSMVHGLAAQSGGDLAIDSAPGRGTRVVMRLPAGDHAPAAEAEDPPLPETLSPLRILLVDDEDLVRTATAEMLAEAGHRVDQAHSGGAAVKMFEAEPGYDLVVTDYAMPLMSGAALIRRVREISPEVRVLLITGYASAATDVPDDVPRIEKPFRAAELLGRIEALNGDRAGSSEAG
jgi:CheY-like chemotaxis protein